MMLALVVGAISFGGDDAKQIFVEFERTLSKRRTASGNLVGKGHGGVTYKSSFLLQKPTSFRIIDGRVNIYCNGTVQLNHLVSEREYFRRDISKEHRFGFPNGLDAFFGLLTGSNAPYYVKKTEFRMQNVDGHTCAAKAIHFESFDRDDRMVFYVDRATKQTLGWDQVFGGTKMHFRFENLRFDVDIPRNAFEWRPPAGVKERLLKRGSGKH